ncbi:MAG: methyltransferase domain-containing protein [Crenarchaeota archaeon]|nr:methyltransferase domain-containing protein [Thermoproteota archaeon]
MYDVPFVPSPEVVIRRMLQLADVRENEVVYDLGCGDGRVLIIAAKEFGARAVGIEIRRDLYEQCLKRIRDLGLEDRVKVYHGNFFEYDLSDADVVTLYLLTSVNERLRPKLERELRPGTRVVSHDFEVPGWRPIIIEDLYEEWRSHKLYLYKVPGAEIPIPSDVDVPLEALSDLEKRVLKYIDGSTSIEDIARKLGTTLRTVREIVEKLRKMGAVKEVKVVKGTP